MNPDSFKLPDLFDATFSRQDFGEFDLLINQNQLTVPQRFSDAYFMAAYFKDYFQRLLLGIDNSLIPTHQFETHDSLEWLSHEAQKAKLTKLIKEM